VRRVITRFYPENVKANQPLIELLQRLSGEKGATPAQISLAWMMAKWPFVTPIPGGRKAERIKENLGAAELELTAGELARIEEELARIRLHGNRTDEDILKLRAAK
jgi:aryl-alcohol dehydrogenase-like predicted oxidoreductase